MIRELRAATVVFLLLTIVTGVAYPAFVTLVAQAGVPGPGVRQPGPQSTAGWSARA